MRSQTSIGKEAIITFFTTLFDESREVTYSDALSLCMIHSLNGQMDGITQGERLASEIPHDIIPRIRGAHVTREEAEEIS